MRNPSSTSGSGPLASPPPAGRKRGPTPCCSKVGMKRGPWTPEEDEVLANFVRQEGEGRWRTLPKRAGLLRCGKSCRLRWMNYLRPSIKHGHIASDEEDLILRLHRLLGNRWSLIAGRIPGRTDNEIKNYWNTHLSKKLISQGIDPRTHKPLNTNSPNTLPDLKLKAPAHPNAPVPYPNPSLNSNPKAAPKPKPSSLEVGGSSRDIILREGHSNYFGVTDLDRTDAWRSSEVFATAGLQGSHGGNGCEEDGDADCCTDDVFSTFFNSLINEEMFLQQQQQHNIHSSDSNSNNNNNQTEPIDPAMSSAPAVRYGALREDGLASSATLNEDAHGRSVEYASRQF